MYSSAADTHPAPAPVAIGGVGGSGTRLVAELLLALGFDLGYDLNESLDNLSFTLLLKRLELWPAAAHGDEIQRALSLFLGAARGTLRPETLNRDYLRSLAVQSRPTHPGSWLQERVLRLETAVTNGRRVEGRWGWKEPNTHIFLDALNQHIPDLRYIHVVRNGLDMAFSENQHQLLLWGRAMLGLDYQPETAEDSFRYWAEAHRRILHLGGDMGTRFLLLNFDQLCLDPAPHLEQLARFLDLEPDAATLQELQQLIRIPASLGRHRREPDLSTEARDLATLEELGFSV